MAARRSGPCVALALLLACVAVASAQPLFLSEKLARSKAGATAKTASAGKYYAEPKVVSWHDAQWSQCRADVDGPQHLQILRSSISCPAGDDYYSRHGNNGFLGSIEALGSGNCEYVIAPVYADDDNGNSGSAPITLPKGVQEIATVTGTCWLTDDNCFSPLCADTVITIQGHLYETDAWSTHSNATISLAKPDPVLGSTDPSCCYIGWLFGITDAEGAAPIFGSGTCTDFARRRAAQAPAAGGARTLKADGAKTAAYGGYDNYEPYGHDDGYYPAGPTTYYSGTAYVISGTAIINSPRHNIEEVATIEYVPIVTGWTSSTTRPTKGAHVVPYKTRLLVREEGYSN